MTIGVDENPLRVVGRAKITVGNHITHKKSGEPLKESTFAAVVYRNSQTGAYLAAACCPPVQMTGIDEVDCTAALADAIENMMLDRNYDSAALCAAYGASEAHYGAYYEATYRQFTERRFVRAR